MVDRVTEAKLRMLIEGDEQVAQRLDAVDEKLDKSTTTQQRNTDSKKEATGATNDLTAAEGDFIGVLAGVNPELATIADLGLKMTKVFNTAGDSTTSLTQVFGSLRNVLGENIGLLKFFGAAGAVIAGIYAITKAVESMKKEYEDATKNIEANIASQTRLAQEGQSRATEIGTQSAARGRPITLGEQEQLSQAVEQVLQRLPGLDRGRAVEAAAALGPGADADLIEQAALQLDLGLQAFPFDRTPEHARRGVSRVAGTDAGAIATRRAGLTQAGLLQSSAERALGQLSGGERSGIIEFIKQARPGISDEEAQELARAVQGVEAVRGQGGDDLGVIDRLRALVVSEGQTAAETLQTGGGINPRAVADERRAREQQRLLLENEGFPDLTPEEIAEGEAFSRLIRNRARRGSVNVTINNNNTRTTVPARGRDPVSNGETAAEQLQDF